MPEMSGLDLCREIRSRVSVSYTYFILLTARTGTQNLIEGLRAGTMNSSRSRSIPTSWKFACALPTILSLESRNLVIFSLAKLAEAQDPGNRRKASSTFANTAACWVNRFARPAAMPTCSTACTCRCST